MRLWRVVAATVLGTLAFSAEARAQQAPDPTWRLTGLCQAWGLLKYHHPSVATRADWDAAFLAAVPVLKSSETREGFNQELIKLVAAAGPGDTYREALDRVPDRAAELGEPFRWIDDPALWDPETGRVLKAIVLSKRPGANAYVTSASGVGNADFTRDEAYYSSAAFDDEALRLLTLCRYWNMVQYYFPYKDVTDRDWLEVLPELVPKFVRASDALGYHLAVSEMTASINDAHASTWSGVLATHAGQYTAPIEARLVEGRTVVTRVFPRLIEAGVDLRVGDVVTHVGEREVEALRASLRPFVNGSNEASLERNIHARLLRTNEARLRLTVVTEAGAPVGWDVKTVTLESLAAEQNGAGGESSAILAGNVGYVHMGRLQVAEVGAVMARLQNTRAIVFDARNYPYGTLYALSNYLNPSAQPFAKFTRPDFDHPGRFVWTGDFTAGPGTPNAWGGTPAATFNYKGRVVVLVNQETQSAAEFTAMALRTAPGATVIGSQTAGADGNVSLIRLPGGVSTYFSGIGVFYPDGRPTQRVGIVPDVVARPTLEGLRAGRDEVLDTALDLLR